MATTSRASSLRRSGDRIATALVTAGIPLAVSCAGPPAGPSPLENRECRVAGSGEAGRIGDTIIVALAGTVEPDHAPVPGNAAERLLFGQLYRRLVRVDCQGRVRPDLAVSWESGAGGRRWRFELDPAANAPDGRLMTAWQVVSALAARLPPVADGGGDTGSWTGGAGQPAPRGEAMVPEGIIDSLRAEGEFTVVAYLAGARRSPSLFGDPAFAMSGPGDASAGDWPPQGGPFRVVEPTPVGARPGSIFLSRGVDSDEARVVFWPAADDDPRDLMEAGADLLLTDDLDVVEYARTRAEFASEALPWERAYVLAATTRVRELRAGSRLPAPELDAGLLRSLARDAVRATARAHAGVGWWKPGQLDGCAGGGEAGRAGARRPPPVPSGAYGTSGQRRLVYDATDPIARDLAERLVALSASGESLAGIVPDLSDEEALVAIGRDRSAFAGSLSRGEEFAYLLSLPLRVYDACLELERLRRRAEWLSAWDLDPVDVVVPLVDVRAHVIFRRGVSALELGWDGSLMLMPGSN